MIDLGLPILFLVLGMALLANTLGATRRWPRARGFLFAIHLAVAAFFLARLFFGVPVLPVASEALLYAIMLPAGAMLLLNLFLTARRGLANPQ